MQITRNDAAKQETQRGKEKAASVVGYFSFMVARYSVIAERKLDA